MADRSMTYAAALALLLSLSTSACRVERSGTQQAAVRTVAALPLETGRPLSDAEFADVITTLSESGGYFDTDNLISNERSYLHVVGTLKRLPLAGGAYIGVGPDQNFSYVAHARPDIAFMIDVRRDNLLQHLFFKALFAVSQTRAEYLARWLGLPVPPDAALDQLSAASLVERIATLRATDGSRADARALVEEALRTMRVALSEGDRATIHRMHDSFIAEGLALRFASFGRPPRPYYPTLRDLLLETDRMGQPASYLANEDDFQFVRELQQRNLVIPIVGDLGGASALNAIGAYLAARQQAVHVFYVSNAEDYVMRDGNFSRYVASVQALPRDENSVLIRSWFGGGTHPHSVPGYFSVQLAQSFTQFFEIANLPSTFSYGALAFSPHIEP